MWGQLSGRCPLLLPAPRLRPHKAHQPGGWRRFPTAPPPYQTLPEEETPSQAVPCPAGSWARDRGHWWLPVPSPCPRPLGRAQARPGLQRGPPAASSGDPEEENSWGAGAALTRGGCRHQPRHRTFRRSQQEEDRQVETDGQRHGDANMETGRDLGTPGNDEAQRERRPRRRSRAGPRGRTGSGGDRRQEETAAGGGPRLQPP